MINIINIATMIPNTHCSVDIPKVSFCSFVNDDIFGILSFYDKILYN